MLKTNHPIRILQVLTIMNRGGAENMIMNYYRSIDRSKIQFDFLLHRQEKGAFEDEIISLGGTIYRMPAISVKNYFNYIKNLNDFFNDHPEYNIVHSHLDSLSFMVLRIAKKYNVKTRIAHSHLAIEPFGINKLFSKNTNLIEALKDTLKFTIRRSVNKQATHFFACGEKAGIWLFGEKNKNRIFVINNAIDAKKFSYDEDLAIKMKNELSITGKKIIGHVGRFNEQKNHVFLIQIFKELLVLDKNFVLILVGEGNLKNKIEKNVEKLNIKDQVLFLGLRSDVPNLLQAMDLLLFPSLYEGLPVSLIEAQASGLKVITSDTVSKESAITDLITFCDLKLNAAEWAKIVLENINYNRKDISQVIIDNNYDIYNNSKKLQEFYLSLT